MPRKGTSAPRYGQPYPAARTISHSRKTVPSQTQDHNDDDIAGDDDAGAEAEGDDESMAEMLVMLQEFQKRKATKTSARSVAFQNQKGALYADARKRVEKAIHDGTSSVESARRTISDLKAKELSQEGALATFKALQENQHECVQGLLGNLTGMIEDLAHRRAGEIDAASATLEAQVAERENSRRRLLTQARTCIAENIENQKIATDAIALVKHYKALLRS